MEDEGNENGEVPSLTSVEFRGLIVYMDMVNENDILQLVQEGSMLVESTLTLKLGMHNGIEKIKVGMKRKMENSTEINMSIFPIMKGSNSILDM